MTESAAPVTVAIVGGGFTGAAVAWHLARGGVSARIAIYEPRERLGAGLAYDTAEPVHRINVPADRMSLDPDDREHFVRWLARDPEALRDATATLPDGRAFPRRTEFGRYVASHLRPYVDAGAIRHVRGRVVRVAREGRRYAIRCADGSADAADLVVIASSHPPPVPPAGLAGARGDPRLIADPLAPGALDRVAPTARVLVVGTGLTMADTVAALDRRGHRGPILAVSRRGQRSHGHGPAPEGGIGDFAATPSTTTLALTRRVRTAVRAAAAAGHTWHGVFDALRRQGGDIWTALPLAEQARLVRHLRPYWDTHRFRIAPQVEAVLDARIAAGTLAVIAAAPVAATPAHDHLGVTLRRRGGGVETMAFDAVVVTTGPGHGAMFASQEYLAGLAADGLTRSDPLRLGIECDRRTNAVGRDGQPVPTLFVAGPLARATFGELMGLPEVAVHARTVATMVAAQLTEAAARPGEAVARRAAAMAR